MTYEKAKYFLHPDTTREALFGMNQDEGVALVEQACIVACEALDKQIAKKPNRISETEDVYADNGKYVGKMESSQLQCPVCGGCVGVDECVDAFCKYCGQKLDWGNI